MNNYRVKRKKKFAHFIVTDENNKPMAWDDIGNQLAYCTDDSWQDIHHPIECYTLAKAKRLIKKSNTGKKKPDTYRLMPVEPVIKLLK